MDELSERVKSMRMVFINGCHLFIRSNPKKRKRTISDWKQLDEETKQGYNQVALSTLNDYDEYDHKEYDLVKDIKKKYSKSYNLYYSVMFKRYQFISPQTWKNLSDKGKALVLEIVGNPPNITLVKLNELIRDKWDNVWDESGRKDFTRFISTTFNGKVVEFNMTVAALWNGEDKSVKLFYKNLAKLTCIKFADETSTSNIKDIENIIINPLTSQQVGEKTQTEEEEEE